MNKVKDLKRYRDNLRSEKDAIALYTKLAESEKTPELRKIYLKLSETEKKHALFWEEKLRQAGVKIPVFRQTLKTRLFGWLAKTLGPSAILPALTSIEKSAASGYDSQSETDGTGMTADERSHARVFGYLSNATSGMKGSDLAKSEGRHRTGGGNSLRAAVLGANDGLVSIFCLVMGVAGAGIETRFILLTGLSGLLAGSLSMALGEWLSVQNSREFYENQINVEKAEFEEAPEEEIEELALIYQAKGIDGKTANELAGSISRDHDAILDTLTREELGINPEELGGSSILAASTSFLLFAAGGILPVIPYLFFAGIHGIIASAFLSTAGLFSLGALTSFMTGKGLLISGLRQVLIGLATAGVTFAAGSLIGVNLR